MLLYDTVKEIRKAFRLRPLLLHPPTSLSLSTTVHLCTQHHLTSVSLSLSTLYHPLVPSGSQWRMPEPGEVAREASQRNLPGYRRHQLQTHHARVTRPRRRTPLLGLLCSSWVLTGAETGALSTQSGWEEEGRDNASQAPEQLVSTPSSATNSWCRPPTFRSSSPRQELPSSSTSALIPQQAGRRSDALHTRDVELVGQSYCVNRRGSWPASRPNCPPAQKPPFLFSEAKTHPQS